MAASTVASQLLTENVLMKQYHALPPLFFLISLLAFIPASYAQYDDMLQVSRFGLLSVSPKPEETDVLSVVVEIEFPREIQKVGDALEFLLLNSGYRLEDPRLSGRYQYVLYNFDLPEVHRQIGPITLWDALATIGNDGFFPWANPLSRTIRFELNDDISFYISEAEIDCAKEKWLNRHDPEYTPCIANEKASISVGDASTPIRYGPIRYGETLGGIARALQIDDVTIEQLMAGLFIANPSVFGDNINVMLAGATLTIPGADTIKTISIERAQELVRTHHQQWCDSRRDKRHD